MRIYRAASGSIERVQKRAPVSLEDLQAAVGGYIEPIPGAGFRAFCNEDGYRLGLPLNLSASLRFGQPLVGDIVELESSERTA